MEAPLRGPLITILPWRHPGHYISCLATDSLAPKFNAQCTGCARRLGLTDEQVSGGSTYGSGVEGNILWRVLSISLYGNIAWIFLHRSICGIEHSSVWNKMFPYWSIYFVTLNKHILSPCVRVHVRVTKLETKSQTFLTETTFSLKHEVLCPKEPLRLAQFQFCRSHIFLPQADMSVD